MTSRASRMTPVIHTTRIGVPDDLFVACASFERRCLGAVQSLGPSYSCRASCIVRFLPSQNDMEGFEAARDRHTGQLVDALSSRTAAGKPEVLLCYRSQPSDGLNQLRDLISRRLSEGLTVVTIDMSTFTKLYFLEVLNFILDLPQHPRVRVLYSTATVPSKKALSLGALAPVVLPRYLGQYSPSRMTALLGFVGFEPERAIRIYEEYEPDLADLFVGESEGNPTYGEKSARVNQYLLTRPGVRSRRVPAYDLKSAYGALVSAQDRNSRIANSELNYVLMSLGTKVHNLAIGLFCRRHPEARLAYAFPSSYQSTVDRVAGPTLSFDLSALKLD